MPDGCRGRGRAARRGRRRAPRDAREPVGELLGLAALDGADDGAEQHRGGHEALLGAVVEVALDAPARRVAGLDDARARRLQLLRELAQLEQRGVEDRGSASPVSRSMWKCSLPALIAAHSLRGSSPAPRAPRPAGAASLGAGRVDDEETRYAKRAHVHRSP